MAYKKVAKQAEWKIRCNAHFYKNKPQKDTEGAIPPIQTLLAITSDQNLKNNFNICTWNKQGPAKKLREVKYKIEELKVDISVLPETNK